MFSVRYPTNGRLNKRAQQYNLIVGVYTKTLTMISQEKLPEKQYYNELFKARGRFDQFQVEIYEQVAREARKGTQGQMALDLGCGSGTQTLCLMGEGFQVVSMDLSFEATKVAKTTLSRSGAPLRIVNGDAEHLPFPDASVDACVCSLFLHHFRDLDGVAKELKRIIRPGGVVVATDANAHNPFVFLFFNVIHRIHRLSWLTSNQRALWCRDVEESFNKFGFEDFHFDSFTTDLRRDWLGGSFAYSVNFYTRALLMWISGKLLSRIARGNGLLSVFRRSVNSTP